MRAVDADASTAFCGGVDRRRVARRHGRPLPRPQRQRRPRGRATSATSSRGRRTSARLVGPERAARVHRDLGRDAVLRLQPRRQPVMTRRSRRSPSRWTSPGPAVRPGGARRLRCADARRDRDAGQRLGRHRGVRLLAGAARDRPAGRRRSRLPELLRHRPRPPDDALRDRSGTRLVQRRQRRAADDARRDGRRTRELGRRERARTRAAHPACTPSSPSRASPQFIRDFDPTQGGLEYAPPTSSAPPALVGLPKSGDTLTCLPGTWTSIAGTPDVDYAFRTPEGLPLRDWSASPAYTPGDGDARAARRVRRARARQHGRRDGRVHGQRPRDRPAPGAAGARAGAHARAHPRPGRPARTSLAPRTAFVSVRCAKRRCTVRVRATDRGQPGERRARRAGHDPPRPRALAHVTAKSRGKGLYEARFTKLAARHRVVHRQRPRPRRERPGDARDPPRRRALSRRPGRIAVVGANTVAATHPRRVVRRSVRAPHPASQEEPCLIASPGAPARRRWSPWPPCSARC